MDTDLHTGNTIRTVTGRYVDVFKPKIEMFSMRDIAHSLSNMPRFGGHTNVFYSVAQHSIFCAYYAPLRYKMQALLHDASEAYMLDMPAPIKRRMREYKTAEEKLMKVIAKKYNFEYPINPLVKEIDKLALQVEHRRLMLGEDEVSDEHGIIDKLLRMPQREVSNTFYNTFLTIRRDVRNAKK